MEHAVPYRRGHAPRGDHTLPELFGAVEFELELDQLLGR